MIATTLCATTATTLVPQNALSQAKSDRHPTHLDFASSYCPLAAALSPSLIASASLTYLPFLVVP